MDYGLIFVTGCNSSPNLRFPPKLARSIGGSQICEGLEFSESNTDTKDYKSGQGEEEETPSLPSLLVNLRSPIGTLKSPPTTSHGERSRRRSNHSSSSASKLLLITPSSASSTPAKGPNLKNAETLPPH